VRNASGRPVDYTWFGATDCRAGRLRSLASISLVVIHNGGTSAAQNVINWQCSEGTAAHYTIQRDGRVFQHIGEERVASHARGVNSQSIGIELNRSMFKGKSCNALSDNPPR
jgi:N-acetyl-anhydromuramyl-L-alanine amidase AmpD